MGMRVGGAGLGAWGHCPQISGGLGAQPPEIQRLTCLQEATTFCFLAPASLLPPCRAPLPLPLATLQAPATFPRLHK